MLEEDDQDLETRRGEERQLITFSSLSAFCFIVGIALVFFKYPFIGMLVEGFGFLNLFGSVSQIFYLLSARLKLT